MKREKALIYAKQKAKIHHSRKVLGSHINRINGKIIAILCLPFSKDNYSSSLSISSSASGVGEEEEDMVIPMSSPRASV